MKNSELEYRREIAVKLLSEGLDEDDLKDIDQYDPYTVAEVPSLLADIDLDYPSGLAPIPEPIEPRPGTSNPLPQADVLVITWTVAELNGLADVLTPGFSRRRWYFYRRRFDDHYDNLIRNGAPAKKNRRLGSWFKTKIGNLSVICYKSELHLNQDGINLDGEGPDAQPANSKTGFATLPVKDMFEQLIKDVKPKLVITTGTSGATFIEHDLGDVVVTRGARFRLSDEFKNMSYNGINIEGAQYKSEWVLPTSHFEIAKRFMATFKNRLKEPPFAPPTKRFPFEGDPLIAKENDPDIRFDGNGEELLEFHPILTTDFFEFGTSDNKLELEGAAVEMGDAVLGLVCEELKERGEEVPDWVVVRNISDPQINADLQTSPRNLNMQIHWAVWYYEKYGYWTSVNGALACWAIIAGYQE
ncbi:MAG: hypothetical protein DHS20C13_08790 [Thermodesulfobacteriota bacterium]|nr:MAG: hypothetical protein DHS20C13_08790 [Thermodesulfobacteriota bacterium]